MKLNTFLLLGLFAMSANVQAAPSGNAKSSVKKWLSGTFGEHLQLSFNKQKIQFDGCKLKAYSLLITKPLGDYVSLDMSLGYAKGRNSWGIFSQTVLIKSYQITPRWHFEDFSVGVGLSVQQSHQLRTSHGPELNLPLQKQWSIEADLPALAENHSTRVSLVRQQWQANNLAFSSTNYKARNTALMVNYSILF